MTEERHSELNQGKNLYKPPTFIRLHRTTFAPAPCSFLLFSTLLSCKQSNTLSITLPTPVRFYHLFQGQKGSLSSWLFVLLTSFLLHHLPQRVSLVPERVCILCTGCQHVNPVTRHGYHWSRVQIQREAGLKLIKGELFTQMVSLSGLIK